ncbi:MAG: ABC transporter substrate-binding protein, partial [Actinomycetia bacterium]|nr:ABC transporter substrate-binding protein [Actinomycetes bacterium]
QQSFDMLALLKGEIDASQAMIYNEYAQVLEAVNPDTGELYVASDLSVINWNDVGTAMLQDAIWADGARLTGAGYQDLTRRFVAGSLEGWAYCRDNSSDCVDIVLANGSALGASHQAWQMNEINGLIWPSPNGVGMMEADLWAQTVAVATSQPILTAAPDAGAYTTEYVEAALVSLNGRGMDTVGASWQRVEVTLNEGGE